MMGIVSLYYFDTFEEAKLILPKVQKEYKGLELIIIKEREGNYSISVP